MQQLHHANLMPEMQNGKRKTIGVTTLILERISVVDHAKLPNWLTVTLVEFTYFGGKIKAFPPLEAHIGSPLEGL